MTNSSHFCLSIGVAEANGMTVNGHLDKVRAVFDFADSLRSLPENGELNLMTTSGYEADPDSLLRAIEAVVRSLGAARVHRE